MICLTCFSSADASVWMKGADLYSWIDLGQTWYALLPGTNRLKHSDELLKAKVTSAELMKKLDRVPKETYVTWNNSVGLENAASLKLALPPKQELKLIKNKMAKLRLKVQ